MCKKLYIIGASGHGKVVADLAVKCGYREIAFLDDYATGSCVGYPIIGTSADMEKLQDGSSEFVIAIGNNGVRKRIAKEHSVTWATLVHPSAQIAMQAQLGEGTVVMAGAVINPCAVIGKHCIINSSAVVEHDNVLADFVHISPKAALGGTVCVGEMTHIGIGAAVRNNINICSGCTIGAGAVIVEDIHEVGVYAGVPGRKKE